MHNPIDRQLKTVENKKPNLTPIFQKIAVEDLSSLKSFRRMQSRGKFAQHRKY